MSLPIRLSKNASVPPPCPAAPSLLALVCCARWHNRFIMPKDQLIDNLRDKMRSRLRASPMFSRLRRSVSSLRRVLRRLRYQLRPSVPFGSRHATRSARALRRFVSLWRRRKSAGSDRP